MALFAFPVLAVFLIGFLAFGITASNHYYTEAHTQGFWDAFIHNLTTGFGLTTAVKNLFTQVVTNYMSRAAAAVDAPVGTTFHYLAGEVKAAADTMLAFSAFALTVAGAVTGQVAWGEVSAALKQLRAQIRAAEHKAQTATEAAIRQEKVAVRSVAQGVYPRLRGLEHDVERTIPREITNLRAHVKAIEDGAVHTFDWIKSHPWTAVTGAFAGAVAVALTRLGLGWLRCSSNPFNNNKNACRSLGALGDLLGLAGIALSVADLYALIELAQKEVKPATQVISDLVGVSKDLGL